MDDRMSTAVRLAGQMFGDMAATGLTIFMNSPKISGTKHGPN